MLQWACPGLTRVGSDRPALITPPPPRRLPERLRPSSFAFGTLADGFLAFSDTPSNGKRAAPPPALASVVMKCVQARHPATAASATPSALKIGDDEAHVKVRRRVCSSGEGSHACGLQERIM